MAGGTLISFCIWNAITGYVCDLYHVTVEDGKGTVSQYASQNSLPEIFPDSVQFLLSTVWSDIGLMDINTLSINRSFFVDA